MFARHFPTLIRYPLIKWLMIPVVFLLTIALVIGALDPTWGMPKKPCNPCRDHMMEQLDEYLCTGRVRNIGSYTAAELTACRKKLGKPAEY